MSEFPAIAIRRLLVSLRIRSVLAQHSSSLKNFDWARLTFELDSCMDEVHSLVRAIYHT